jgi:hypothetical protein
MRDPRYELLLSPVRISKDTQRRIDEAAARLSKLHPEYNLTTSDLIRGWLELGLRESERLADAEKDVRRAG